MSEKSSEYLKRTCLICGCHTDQTINIYEPRSGPNIVELIQAKFKIQPLNEEKYLCFSCNNWLINWHSLQALNSNDGESPPGTFRPQMNGMLYKEASKNQCKQTQTELCSQTISDYRPIAKVRPWCANTNAHTTTSANHLHPKVFKEYILLFDRRKRISKFQFRDRTFYYDKRRLILRNTRLRCRYIKYKSVIGYNFIPSIQLKNQRAIQSLNILPIFKTKKVKKKKSNLNQIKCSDDKHIRKPKHEYEISQKNIFNPYTQSIESNNNDIINFDEHTKKNIINKQFLSTPLVDGKVVSMLRRLGTTLSRDNCNEKTITSPQLSPQIMSPRKSKPQWTRQLDEDEILLNFDSAITEVLPQVVEKLQDDEKCKPEIIAAIPTKRKLTYQVSIGKDSSQYVYPTLPEGLSISLI